MKTAYLTTSAIALLAAMPVAAQTAATTSAQNQAPTGQPGQEATTDADGPAGEGGIGDIIVTAQRQSQRLQDVPISVSAFTAENLERQQIVNPLVLQQSLPSVTFTKTNFGSSSFTIRGIGDLCVGNCDQATAIHVNDMPLVSTRLFETEFFDLERVEVLRGPQGTLFGRNATAGVVNFITARPDLTRISAAGEFEYGNFDSKRARAMFNLPITDTLGVRVAGTYLNRDGYTLNLFDGNRIDDRDLYAVRGTLSWAPTASTRLDLMAYYFHEDDNRSRYQKQLCNRDSTGVLGCSPDRLEFGTTNGLSNLASVLSSREFLRTALSSTPLASLAPVFANFGLNSIYGTDPYSGVVNPTDVRTVRVDYTPRYFADEEHYMAKFFHDFGAATLNVTGGYARNTVRSSSDFNLAVQNPLTNNPGLVFLNAVANGGAAVPGLGALIPGTGISVGAALQGPIAAIRNVLTPNGAVGGVCQSAPDRNNVGVYGGNSLGCFAQSLDVDQSEVSTRQWSAEAHIDSKFDGPFNFLIGGIYLRQTIDTQSYYVNSFGLDYAAGLLGAVSTLAARLGGAPATPNLFRASPFYHTNADFQRLNSYGIFGEAYYEATDRLKLTVGLRYNDDSKRARSRITLLNDSTGAGVNVPIGSGSITDAIGYSGLDFDVARSGPQEFYERSASFRRLTGRAVVDYRITRNNLLYASYSRGYKSGGINPPILPAFNVPETFGPEQIDAFEIGSKNTFANGQLRLNVSGFYYRYNGLQVARIVSQNAINDNINADIYGAEAEAIMSPIPALVINTNFSYLKTRIRGDQFIENPRDPSGGRSDAVIIKDLTSAANCAVVPTGAGVSAAAVNAYVGAVNSAIGLRAPTPVPGTNTTGAFGICSALAGTAAAPSAALRAAFGVPTGALPFQVLGSGVAVNVRGNSLPQAPTYKASVGAQYSIDVGSGGWTIIPRADLNYTGGFTSSIFNLPIDRIRGYEIVNAQVQLNAPDERFYVRAFVQNLTSNDAITGQYVSDQATGLFTNVFTVEPRRYGIAAGFKF